MEETHVDQYPGGVILDVVGITGAVVGVVPLVGGKQQLHESVWDIGLRQGGVHRWALSHARQRLQDEAEEMLQTRRYIRNACSALQILRMLIISYWQ